MAKGAISKNKAPSKHSREARRATSPSINTDKSLKDVKPPPESINHRPSVLAIHQGAGVSKKQKRGKILSTRAKKRVEKSQDKAIAIIERTENKVAKSKGSSRNIQTRRKDWEAINKSIPLSTNVFDSLNDDEDEESGDSEGDNEMAEVKKANSAALQAAAAKVPVPDAMDDDDAIL